MNIKLNFTVHTFVKCVKSSANEHERMYFMWNFFHGISTLSQRNLG